MHYMHYKDYIYHDFYVYSPVLLTQYLGHCWHTPCTELYILRISAWLLRKPPLPCHRGGEPSGWGRGGCGGPCSYIHVNKHLKSDWKDLYLPRSSTCLPRTSQAQASSFAKAIPRVIPQMLRVHTAQIPQSLWPTLVAIVAASRCFEHPEL